VGNRPQQRKTARRRSGGTLKDGQRRRLAAASRARRGEEPHRPVAWCDGGVRGERAAAAFVLSSPSGRLLAEEVRLIAPGAIEDIECAAVAAALERAVELRLDELEVRLDSRVVVDWLNAAHRPAASRRPLRPILAQLPRLGRVSFRWVSRDENAHADQLVWTALG
jgi:ribonuclease H / adenosylcobalamin/alpha-ribazole phosphatase